MSTVAGDSVIDIVFKGQALLIFILGLVGAVGAFAFRQHVMNLVVRGLADAAPKIELHAVRERVDSHGGRLTSIEAAIRHMPTAEQVNALTVAISDLRGEVRAVGENVESLERSMLASSVRIERIETHLMERR